MLRRFGLKFHLLSDERNERQMDVAAVFLAYLVFNLPDCLDKWQGLYVADRTSDFGDYHIRAGFLGRKKHAPLDFISYVRNDLNCSAVEFSFALVIEDSKIDAARCGVVAL